MKKSVIVLTIIFSCFVFKMEAQNSADSKNGKLVVASCQFPISANISENYDWIKKQINEAKLKKADVVHFPECALSGYPGVDLKTLENFDWDKLHELTDSVLSLAKQLKIWVLLGSIHQLSEGVKPHNSLYVINSEGEIIDRYDKRFCTSGDLKYFSPGDHFVNFDLNGINCGLLICYDVRFPELFREYKKLDADLIFHSLYNARQRKGSIHPIIMPITAQARAATNFFYMSLTNSSASESWPCHFITPDGLIQNKLTTNIPGVLISKVDLSEKFYDASRQFRGNAMNGILNSGETVNDPQSKNRTNINK
jgi:deaminated glutathione amidase